jgi:hypothetical protein
VSDAWDQMLYELEPELDECRRIMNLESIVRPVLRDGGGHWVVYLDEVYPETYWDTATAKLDHVIYWTANQLSTWPEVEREGRQGWKFIHKKHAEKFIMLYNIVWAQ